MSFEEKLEALRATYGMKNYSITELDKVKRNSEAYEMLVAELSAMLGIDLEAQLDILLNDPDIVQAIEESSRR